MKQKQCKLTVLPTKTTPPLILALAVGALLLASSCGEDWGRMDEPAGNQVYPKLEKVAEFTFDDEILPESFETIAYNPGSVPVIANDDDKGMVLAGEGGYVRIANPLNAVKVQNGVSLTFWVKLPAEAEGVEQALFSFTNAADANHMYFTTNGRLSYSGAEGNFETNAGQSALMADDAWHYLAIAVTNTNFFVHVDSNQVINQEITGFDASQIVQFMAKASYLNMGYGLSGQNKGVSFDDLKVYRNTITEKESAMPSTGGGEESVPFISIVGNKDMSTGWWSAFSNYLSGDGDVIFHLKFKNYTNGSANWNNWVLVVTNGIERGGDGYAEHFVLRADAYGWGTNYVGGNIVHNYDWSTFTEDMKGATVDLTVTRRGTRAEMKAITTTTSGKILEYTYFVEGVPTGTLGMFLTCEGSYLEMDKQNISVGKLYGTGVYRVGATDFSAGWWSVFSNIVKTNNDFVVNYQFYNYTNGTANWNNWVLVVTNGLDRGETGYAEHFVLRADAYGWGTYYVGANIAHDYVWDTFTSDMNGAYVDLTLKMVGKRIEMTAVTTTTGNKTYTYTYYHNDIPVGEVASFLTLEGAYIDIVSVSTNPFINSKNAE